VVLVETAVEMLLMAFVYHNCSTLYPGNKIGCKSDSLKTQCHAMVPAKVNLSHLIKVPLFLTNSLLFLHLVISKWMYCNSAYVLARAYDTEVCNKVSTV